VPTVGESGGLSAGVVFGERRAIDAEQARQDFRAVGPDRERPSRQAQGCGSGALRHGRQAGSLLAQAQAGHQQASQSLRNHRPLLEQTDLKGRHFHVSRILETWKYHVHGFKPSAMGRSVIELKGSPSIDFPAASLPGAGRYEFGLFARCGD
jgi:hypothetical protein